MQDPAQPEPALLDARGLAKSYGPLRALDGVDFTLRAGQIHALLGENGAGKSTFIKVITGVLSRDSGVVRLQGAEVAPHSAREAVDAGIATVYQEVNLLPNLSVAQNVYLCREPTRLGIVRDRQMKRGAAELLHGYGLKIDVSAPLGTYSVAIQHVVAIARAVDLSARVLILDEPTASLESSCCSTPCAALPRAASASSSSRIFSTRSTRSPTASRCCVTAARSASGPPPRCRAWS
jgi:simple sugar transport system ATP-binding protein